MIWKWLKERRRKKRSLKLNVTQQEYNAFRQLASEANKSPEQWAKERLLAQIPSHYQERRLLEARRRAAMGTVFSQLDLQDSLHPTEAMQTVADAVPPLKVLNNHPCQFLDPTPPPNLERACSGVCREASQGGRVCFWTPTMAKECLTFKSKYASKTA